MLKFPLQCLDLPNKCGWGENGIIHVSRQETHHKKEEKREKQFALFCMLIDRCISVTFKQCRISFIQSMEYVT